MKKINTTQLNNLALGRLKGVKRNRPSGLKYNITKEGKSWFKKGHVSWNKNDFGLKTWMNISGFKSPSKGRAVTWGKKITEGKIRNKSHIGNRNSSWKGGITPLNKRLRRSIEYKLWRIAVFIRDNYTCQMCSVKGGKLNADHIKPFAYYPDLRFAIDNGRTLCESCHKQTDTYGSKVRLYYEKN